MLLLAQQPFDIGEELIIEETVGWRCVAVEGGRMALVWAPTCAAPTQA
jgi:hypothetical protein